MTRKLAGFGLAFALAELAAAYLPPLASLLTAALFISLFLFAAFTQRRAARFALPAVAGLLAGLVWSAAYQLAVVKPAQSLAGQTYACTAIVQPDAETSWQPGNVRATLLITQLDGRKTSLKVYCTDLPYSEAGNIITGQFQLQPLRADSYRMSRYAKGTWLGASYQADYIWQGTSDALPYRLYHLRQAFAKRLTTYLPQNLAGVEAAMLLGEKSELTDEWSDTFRTAGIAHLLAVSGLHVALLCGLFAMGQGRRSRFSVPRVLLQITVLLLYMGLTGLPFSVFRAGVMFLIMLVGSLLLQPPDSLTALALAAIIMGVQQPFAPCDIGFQLSVNGQAVGIVATAKGTLCHKCTAKAARFVRLCDAYSIPVVTVVNTEGFVKSEGDDQAGGIRQAARMAGVYAEATTVKVAILAGEAVGPIYTVFAASADWRIAVDGCTVAPLAPETAATVLYKDEIFASDNIQQATKQKAAAYKAEQCSAVAAVANGAADAAVKAADVRAAAAQALDMLATKRTTRLPKKHGNITL